MQKSSGIVRIFILLLLALVPLSLSMAQTSGTLSGVLSVLYGDSAQGAVTLYRLTTSEGQVYHLDITEPAFASVGGKYNVLGQQVTVTLDGTRARGSSGALPVFSITPGLNLRGDVSAPLAVNQKWANLMCKFGSDGSQPVGKNYLEGFYGSSYRQINHFWSEISRGQISVTQTTHGWRVLPYTSAQYVNNWPLDGSAGLTYLDKVFQDCVGLFDADINFANGYAGIAIILNNIFPSQDFAWGGQHWTNLDGLTKYWNTIWMPPWAYQNLTVWGHEMGHAYGLPHSNNSDGDNNPYDNPWDMMSDGWTSTQYDNTYGVIPFYTIAYHLDLLGWISADKIINMTKGQQTINLDSWYYSGASGDHMVYIPTGESTGFTVEARKRISGGAYTAYEDGLRDDGVIIHSINQSRWEDAWLVNPGDSQSQDSDRTAWHVGQSYTNNKNGFTVEVLSQTPTGYQVRVTFAGFDPNFVNISPEDYSAPAAPQVDFSWGSHESAASYRIIVQSQDRLFKFKKKMTAAEANCTDVCSFSPYLLDGWQLRRGQLHSWRVKAYDVNNNPVSTTSKFRFDTSGMAPTTINKVSPVDNGVVTGSADFVWEDDTRIARYQFEIRDANNVAVIRGWRLRDEVKCNGDTCVASFENIEEALAGAPSPYKWRVRGRTSQLTGKAKSNRWWFSTDATALEFRN